MELIPPLGRDDLFVANPAPWAGLSSTSLRLVVNDPSGRRPVGSRRPTELQPRFKVFVLSEFRSISFSSTPKFLSSELNLLATRLDVDNPKLSNNIAKNRSEFKIISSMNLLLREVRKFMKERRIRDHLQSSAISGIIRGFPSIIRRFSNPVVTEVATKKRVALPPYLIISQTSTTFTAHSKHSATCSKIFSVS